MRAYTLTLRAEGPIFIGSGQKIGKKEYIFFPEQQKVCVPDMPRMFQYLEKRRLLEEYESYLLRDNRDLTRWLRDNRLLAPRQLPSWIAYSLDSGDAVFENRGRREILTFLKDAYGCPYVPGSSVKGMLRTILLSAMLLQNREKLETQRQAVQRADLSAPRTKLLKGEADGLEQRCLHTLRRTEQKSSAVNDAASGLIVSDSRPLSTDDLVLCQKIDITTDGQQKRMPILRECLRPGTEITCSLTVDPTVFPFDMELVVRLTKRCWTAYGRAFRDAFPTRDIAGSGNAYLGGGCGYAAHTVTYPLLGKNSVKAVSNIIDATLPRQVRIQHKHRMDWQKGASPHMLKCTQYGRKLYEMGACSLAIQEIL